MRLAAAILAGFVLVLLPVSATAQTTSGLIRLGARDALLGWEAVGRVAIGDQGYCTGVLIATDLVLTAAHCVYDKHTGAALSEAELSFHAGWRDGKAIAERAVARVAAHSNYDPAAGQSFDKIGHDVALLQLDSPIPAAQAAPFALHGKVRDKQRVSLVSYGRGRDSALSWQRDCGLFGRKDNILAFDCEATFGTSGAPVFVRDGQRGRILALISSVGVHKGKKLAYGMELTGVVADLKRDLRARGPLRTYGKGASVRKLRAGTAKTSGGARFVKSKTRSP